MSETLEDAIKLVAQAKKLDHELFSKAANAMQIAFPDEDFSVAAQLIDREPAEAVLHLVDEHLPDWTISLRGKARETDGEWKCVLRKSSTRDNDAVIGSGSGPTLALAVLSAVLKASILRAQP
jgi:hypothetical protein